MTIASLDRRLRALEARRSGAPTVYLAWGRTPAQAQDALAHALRIDAVTERSQAVALVWPDPDPLPPSRWVVLADGSVGAIGDRELGILLDAYGADIAARERETAAARGEDLSGLDDTDLRIRLLRRESRDLSGDLRGLAIHANPSPRVRPRARGAGGETSVIDDHRRHAARIRAWLERYLPGERLFT